MRKWQEAAYGPPGGAAPGEVLPDVVYDFATAITLQLEENVDVAALDLEFGTLTVTKAESYQAQTGYEEERSSTRLIQGCLFLIAAVVIGAFFSNWTIQRTNEIGLIKALGGTNGYVLKEMLLEVIIVVVAAAAIGSIVAYWVGMRFAAVGVPYLLPLNVFAVSIGLFILSSLIGAMLSVRVITSVDPIIAMGRMQ